MKEILYNIDYAITANPGESLGAGAGSIRLTLKHVGPWLQERTARGAVIMIHQMRPLKELPRLRSA